MNREKSIFRSYAPRLFEIARQIRWLYCLSFCIGQYRFVKTRQWVMNGITNMCPSKFFINSQDNKLFTIYWIIAFFSQFNTYDWKQCKIFEKISDFSYTSDTNNSIYISSTTWTISAYHMILLHFYSNIRTLYGQ